jgi:hypothetical protein
MQSWRWCAAPAHRAAAGVTSPAVAPSPAAHPAAATCIGAHTHSAVVRRVSQQTAILIAGDEACDAILYLQLLLYLGAGKKFCK